jgi:hypothetical protein
MLKMLRLAGITLLLVLVAILKAEPLSAEHIIMSYPSLAYPPFQYANVQLWEYVRLGLNYLESPTPLYPPETVPPTYAHPDLKGFGAYGFSPEAYRDVQRLYPFFQNYSWQDILHSQQLYDLANQAFADWLLKNLQSHIPCDATQEQIFDVLHRAWNVGLSGFKKGKEVVPSRSRRAEEFKAYWPTSAARVGISNNYISWRAHG